MVSGVVTALLFLNSNKILYIIMEDYKTIFTGTFPDLSEKLTAHGLLDEVLAALDYIELYPYSKPLSTANLNRHGKKIFKILKEWRDKQPPEDARWFDDPTMINAILVRPMNEPELKSLTGINHQWADQYGEDLFALFLKHH